MIELSGLCSGLALHALRVSASFFDVLRVPALFGRTFAPEEDVDGRHRVAVLSYGWWQRRFGRDPNIVGTTIHLDGGDVEIVGIAPPAVSQALDAETPTDLWMPLVIPDAERMRSPNRYNFYLQALGRLRDGLSRAQASVGLNQMAQVLEAEYPDWNKDRRIGVRPLDEHVVPAGIRSWLLLLLGAVGVVLVIAYANIANLMVARASERQREIGIRAALGASRLRLVRQLVVESLVVSLIGAGVGLVLAWWAVEGLRAAMPDGVPRVVTIALDLRVFAAAVGGAVVSGVVFGLVPAGGCSRPVLTHVLQDGARGATAGRARQRLRSTLVVSEIALAVVLLIGAGLFLVSFVNLMRVDVGFDPAGVLGRFKRSSQHLNGEELRWEHRNVVGHPVRDVFRCGRRVVPRRDAVSIGVGSGRRSPAGCPAKRRRWGPACPSRSERDGSAKVEACRRSAWPLCRGATCRLPNETRSPSCTPSTAGFVISLGESAGPRRPSLGSSVAMRQPAVADSSIARRPRSGTPT